MSAGRRAIPAAPKPALRTPAAPNLARAIPALWSALLATLILGPLLSPGYLLLRDAVSTPRSFLTDQALGADGGAPRAVPQDAVIAVLSHIVDGGVVVKILLWLALWTAGCGAATLARHVARASVSAQVVATTVVVWNPYVAERLLQGHWSLLAGYAALPWAVVFARKLPSSTGWAGVAVTIAAGGLTPTGSILVTIIALVSVRARYLPGVGTLALAAAAPWLVMSLSASTGAADPLGVDAFAARAEPGLGIIGTTLGLGGIWNVDAVPASRLTAIAIVGTVTLLLPVVLSLPRLVRLPAPVIRLAAVGGSAVVLIAVLNTSWGREGLRGLNELSGAFGLLRDSSKWAALLVPIYAIAAALGADMLRRLAPLVVRPLVAVGVTAAVLVGLPDLAWGVSGALRPVHYPSGWRDVTALVNDGRDVAVLPDGMFRTFSFTGSAPVLDPAKRMLNANVLATGDLSVNGHTIRGEDHRAADVMALLLKGGSATELAKFKIGWVLVELDTLGAAGSSQATLQQLEPVYRGTELELYRVANSPAPQVNSLRTTALAAHGLWLCILLAGIVGLSWSALQACLRRRRCGADHQPPLPGLH